MNSYKKFEEVIYKFRGLKDYKRPQKELKIKNKKFVRQHKVSCKRIKITKD